MGTGKESVWKNNDNQITETVKQSFVLDKQIICKFEQGTKGKSRNLDKNWSIKFAA